MYYLVFIILFWASFLEIIKKRRNIYFFYSAFILMTLMTCLRYGQNVDYFHYKHAYLFPDESRNADLLFGLFQDVCRFLGFSYELHVFACGLVLMGLMLPFLVKKTTYSSFSLLIIYSLFFLIYHMGVVRQGIALSILLWSYKYLEEGKKYMFVILIVLGSFVHLSLITSLIIIFIYNKRVFNSGVVLWVLVGMTMFSAFVPDLSWFFQLYFPDRSIDGGFQDTRWSALILRILSIAPVYLIKPPYGSAGYNARSMCLTGYCFYCFLSFDSLIAGRVEVYYRVFFCLFCSYIIFQMKQSRLRFLCLSYVLFLQSAYFFKNINTMIMQADYKENVTMLSFPYISVFEKEEFNYYSNVADKDY